VIWNPGAGGGEPNDDQVADRRAAIEAALRANNVQAELYQSASEADTARRVDAAIVDGISTIVAAGGDGTVRSIAFQLLDRDVALGILPMGTAMNVARSLDIPLELEGAAAVLAAGRTRVIDVGEARGRPFLEVASIGLGAEVLAGATEAGEGRFRIALATIRRAVGRPRTRVRLQLDGREVRGRAVSVAVANGRFTGRGIELAPQASLDDGRFDVLLYEGFGPLQVAADIVRVLLGRANDPQFRRFRARTVRISSHRPLAVRLDSQDVGATPVELVTRAGALAVIAPG
jgi:YegS/Rv2252/BmrU family lipid kinase